MIENNANIRFERELAAVLGKIDKMMIVADEEKIKALEDGGEIFKNAAVAIVQKRSGYLARSIKRLKGKWTGQGVVIGPRKRRGKRARNTAFGFYAHMVEFGSFNHRTGKRNKAKPFMRKAFYAQKDIVLQMITRRLLNKIKKVF